MGYGALHVATVAEVQTSKTTAPNTFWNNFYCVEVTPTSYELHAKRTDAEGGTDYRLESAPGVPILFTTYVEGGG